MMVIFLLKIVTFLSVGEFQNFIKGLFRSKIRFRAGTSDIVARNDFAWTSVIYYYLGRYQK
jgi:hypothetical protein